MRIYLDFMTLLFYSSIARHCLQPCPVINWLNAEVSSSISGNVKCIVTLSGLIIGPMDRHHAYLYDLHYQIFKTAFIDRKK